MSTVQRLLTWALGDQDAKQWPAKVTKSASSTCDAAYPLRASDTKSDPIRQLRLSGDVDSSASCADSQSSNDETMSILTVESYCSSCSTTHSLGSTDSEGERWSPRTSSVNAAEQRQPDTLALVECCFYPADQFRVMQHFAADADGEDSEELRFEEGWSGMVIWPRKIPRAFFYGRAMDYRLTHREHGHRDVSTLVETIARRSSAQDDLSSRGHAEGAQPSPLRRGTFSL